MKFTFAPYIKDVELEEHYGYRKGAITKAQKYANQIQDEVFIYHDEDIIDVVYPD